MTLYTEKSFLHLQKRNSYLQSRENLPAAIGSTHPNLKTKAADLKTGGPRYPLLRRESGERKTNPAEAR